MRVEHHHLVSVGCPVLPERGSGKHEQAGPWEGLEVRGLGCHLARELASPPAPQRCSPDSLISTEPMSWCVQGRCGRRQASILVSGQEGHVFSGEASDFTPLDHCVCFPIRNEATIHTQATYVLCNTFSVCEFSVFQGSGQ